MTSLSLIPFDLEKAPPLTIETEIQQNAEELFISYRIRSGVNLIDFGNGTPKKERTTGLWEKTCFELFIKNQFGHYIEFNFSPTFEWNCFYFEKRGVALSEWKNMTRPKTDILLSLDHFFQFNAIKKSLFPPGFFDSSNLLHAGMTAVIKDKNKAMTYWALAHVESRPNFHHPDSFKYKF